MLSKEIMQNSYGQKQPQSCNNQELDILLSIATNFK